MNGKTFIPSFHNWLDGVCNDDIQIQTREAEAHMQLVNGVKICLSL